jgi:hypothetical protein
MSARGPSSVQPRRSSPRRNNRGPSSAPPAPRRTRTYISIFQTKYGPNTSRGSATNPHRVYGFINNSTSAVHIISGNSLRNKFRNVVENSPRIMRTLRRRFINLPPHYARNIAANILPIREQASINATNQYSRRLQHLNQERKAQNAKLNRNLDMRRISWANHAEKTNKYIRNRIIDNARLKKAYNESRATHQFEIELWRKIQRLVQLYLHGSNANYTKRAITISNRQTRKFMKLQTNLQSRARRTLVS